MNRLISTNGNVSSANEEKQSRRNDPIPTGAIPESEGTDTTAYSPHDPPGEKAHMTTILVNGVEHRVKKGAVGYIDIIALANVDPTKRYRVTFEHGPRGSETGVLVPNGPHTHIGDGEIFTVVEMKIRIIVNGSPKEVVGDTVSFEQIVQLAFGEMTGTCYTVVYEFGPKGEEHGSMEPGQVVHIQNEEVFDVSNTYKS